jgi:uncharacterized SAM-binding protein YcdF (DUF218 family)
VARRARAFKFSLAIVILVVVAVLAHTLWLPIVGRLLVYDDGPAKADIAVVLAGDYYGHRMEKAAELVRAGYVPAILVSGPAGMYGSHECDLAIAFIVRKGYPPAWFIPFPNTALSTREEARDLLPELSRRHIRSFLLVTSDYHTARARRIFKAFERRMPDPPAMRVVATPDEHFRPDSWWRSRQGQKIAFTEWSKSFATALGM